MRDLVREGAQYGTADVLLFDGSPPHRGTTRSALGMLGFKRIMATSDADEVAHSIAQRPYDVLIADLAVEPERICKLVRDVRVGDMGPNPFLVVIFTAWALREDTLGRVMNSGADDILVRPYSVSFLAERVRTLVDARKGFVVTGDYVGPDRRKAAVRPPEAHLLDVPNTLRIKARPDEAGVELKDMMGLVRDAQARLSELRLQGTALQMRLLSHFALKAATEGASLDKYVAPMSAFSRLLYDKLHESRDHALAGAVTSILDSVACVMQGEGVIEALTESGRWAKAAHERLCPDREAGILDREFAHAVTRLGQREARSFRARVAAPG
jgi:DNA-binding response OmpR family regulator